MSMGRVRRRAAEQPSGSVAEPEAPPPLVPAPGDRPHDRAASAEAEAGTGAASGTGADVEAGGDPGVAAPPGRPGRRARGVALAAHLLSLVAGFSALFYANRGQWFFGDEWEFLDRRGVLHGDHSIWAPHTDHWSTVPILVYRALLNLYGVRTYVPYVLVLLVLHVAVTHFLWRIMRAAGADLTVATALAAVYAVLGAGYENLLWAFQIGFIGAVAVGLAVVLLVNHDGRWSARDWAGWVLSVVGLMFSGISVTMVTVAGVTVLMRRGLRDAALTVALPGIVYLVWLVLVGHQSFGAHPHSVDDIFVFPDYIWTGLRSAVEQAVGFPGSGPVLVLGLAAWLLRRGELASGPAAPAFACAFGAIVMYSVIAAGRTSLGAQQSEASRYVYIAVALALPAMALALSQLVEGFGGRQAVVCFLLLLVLIHNLGILHDESRRQHDLEHRLKERLLAAAQLVSTPALILNDHPEPQYDPDIVVNDLRRMQRKGQLPPITGVSDTDRMTVVSVLQYTAGTIAPALPFVQPADDGVVGADEARDDTGCIVLTPTSPTPEIHLTVPGPFSVAVTTQASGVLTGFLRDFSPVLLTSGPRVDKITAGVPLLVSVTANVDQVILRVPPSGTTQVCGVQ
ncbi:MAG TPA: hypothetical protein VHT97_06675 [Acidimicrobiales bacterium]|nr:hypothetical protein [Acidimicrobiales bacterium]